VRAEHVYKDDQLVSATAATGLSAFLAEMYQQSGARYPKFYKMDNLSKLGWLATEILLANSLDKDRYEPSQIGIVLSNANASLDADIKYFESVKEMASPALFVYTLPNIVIGEISIRHNFKGENAFFISEEFDAALLQKYVSNLLNNDILQACICGWVDVLEESYEAVLFLVEKETAADNNLQAFITENLDKTYHLPNG
jgi:hypothetical protein